MIPPIQFTDAGMVAPTREQITAGLWQVMVDAFGTGINQDARTPQGQLVTSLTAIIQDRDSASIELGNNFDPRYATGRFQEALAQVYFLDRKEAVASVAQLASVGIAGTAIPKGFIVIDESGYEWASSADAVVGPALITFVCTVTGPVQAAPGTIRTIKQSIDGLDRLSNPNSAAAGYAEETRADFEDRRSESVAANAKNTNGAVLGAVANLPGVLDVYVRDNPTDDSITVGATNYPMIRNSLLVSVTGGDDYQIAGAIVVKGGTGCAFVGNTSVVWEDEASGNVYPPEYVVKFLRPAQVTVGIRVTVVDAASISYADSEAAKSQIVKDFQAGAYRARIGALVVASNYGINLDTARLKPVKIEITTDGANWKNYIEFGVDQQPTTSAANVTLVSI